MAFQKAIKEQVKLRLALDGLAGTGKSFSSLAIASWISKFMRENKHGEGRIAAIDSERKSLSLYADKFDFDVCELDSFSPLAYVEKIHEAEAAGYDIIIADSISHAWAGKGGALDQKDQAAERSASGNSWTAWRSVTPKHNALVDAMLQCKAHFIATMRVKMDYVQEYNEQTKKTEIKKVGLQSIQREGMEYEFTLVGDIDYTHTLKISKTRIDGIDIGDQFEKPGETFARKIYTWLMSGAAPRPRVEAAPVVSGAPANDVGNKVEEAFAAYFKSLSAATTLAELDTAVTAPARPARGTAEYEQTNNEYKRCKALIMERQQAGAA